MQHVQPIRYVHDPECETTRGGMCNKRSGCRYEEVPALDDLFDRHADVLASHPGPTPHEPTVALENLEDFARYKVATINLRDAEIALKCAQENYRRALEALNKAIAPFPERP